MRKRLNKKRVVSMSLGSVLLLFFLYFLFFVPNVQSNPDTGVTNCTNLTTAGETYLLSNDIHNDQISDACINIFVSNITFNCQGYYLSSIQNYSGIYSNSTNTTIKNCNITMGSSSNSSAFGIFLQNSNYSVLFNNSLLGSNSSGIFFNNSNYGNLTSNTGASNLSYGIYLQSSSNNNLTSNTGASNLSYGIYLQSSSNNTLTNSIGRSNNSAGMYIASSSNNQILTSVFVNNTYGLYLLNSNDSLISNLNSSHNSYGVYIQNSYRSNLIDILANNNTYGIYLSFLNDSSLTDIVTNYNSITGLTILNSFNSTFTNATSNYNGLYGILLTLSNNNTLTAIITNNNSYGIYMRASNYTNLSNGLTDSNLIGGGYIFDVKENILSNMTSTNNQYGIGLEGIVIDNTLKNSYIQFNNLASLIINATGTLPQNNLFYNNYFNDTTAYSSPLDLIDPGLLFGFNWSTVTNYFNTTLTAGKNIVNGPYIGGNYWANPSGTGFSQNPLNCTDRGDGICSTSFGFSTVNYDYLPLVCYESWSCGAWGICAYGKQGRTCRDANLCQTYKYRPIILQDCSESFSSKSSGGGASVSESFKEITPSKPVEMLISTSEMDLTSIILNVNETIADSSITIKSQTNNTNLKIGLPTGRIYQAFEVVAVGINNQNIINSTFNFKINKTWLSGNNITIHFKKDSYWLIENGIVGNIKLYRLPTGVTDWTPLTTSFSKQDEKYYYFYSTSPGFSTFVVFFNKYDCLPGSTRCSGTQVQLCLGNATWLTTEQCSYSCKDGKCSSVSFNDLLITIAEVIIIGAIVIYLILANYKRKKKK